MSKVLAQIKRNVRYKFQLAARRFGHPSYRIHQVRSPGFEVIFVPIPKNACSTVKHALYEMEYGEPYDYRYYEQEGYQNIHDFYNKRKKAFAGIQEIDGMDSAFRFTIVRDPVERLLSCYGNRVVDLEDLSESRSALENMGLDPEPDLNTFVLNLDLYRKGNNSIRHHSNPQRRFLGDDFSWLDKVYPFEEIGNLMKKLQNFYPGIRFRSEKSSGQKFELQDLTGEALDAALEFYAEDYELLKPWYSPRTVRKEYREAAEAEHN